MGSARRRSRQEVRPGLAPPRWGLVVFVGLLGVFTAHCPHPWRQSIDAGRRAAPALIEVTEARAALASDLETYRALRGAYPATLDDLVDERVTSRDRVSDAHIEHYSPDRTGRSYRLRFANAADETSAP